MTSSSRFIIQKPLSAAPSSLFSIVSWNILFLVNTIKPLVKHRSWQSASARMFQRVSSSHFRVRFFLSSNYLSHRFITPFLCLDIFFSLSQRINPPARDYAADDTSAIKSSLRSAIINFLALSHSLAASSHLPNTQEPNEVPEFYGTRQQIRLSVAITR